LGGLELLLLGGVLKEESLVLINDLELTLAVL
jgi:hypothetical protein